MAKKNLRKIIDVLKTLRMADFESMEKLVSIVYLLESELMKPEKQEEKQEGKQNG